MERGSDDERHDRHDCHGDRGYGGLSGFLGAFLMVVGKKTGSGDEDGQVELLTNLLPGNNCGACGFAGCGAMAEALAKGEAMPQACPVASLAQLDELVESPGALERRATDAAGRQGPLRRHPGHLAQDGRTTKACWTAGRLTW